MASISPRPEGIAEAGGVCISDDAQGQIRGKIDLGFEDIGPRALNIAEPMRAWRMQMSASAAVAARQSRQPTPPGFWRFPTNPRSLPFQNMSGDPEREYFADGMVEDIITALGRL